MWQGENELLSEIICLITDAVSSASNTRQQEIASRISVLIEDPQFPCYLLCILTSQSINLTVRMAAGHTLKSALEKNHDLPAPIVRFLQENILNALHDASISSAICNLASTLYVTQEGWPQLLHFLSENLEQTNSLHLLVILFEDIGTYSALAYLLDTPEYAVPMKSIIIKLLEISQTSNSLALKAVNQLLKFMPVCLMPFVEKYLQILLVNQSSEHAAEGIFILSCSRKDIVKKYFAKCAEVMIPFMNSPKGGIACNFWMEFISEKNLIAPFLQSLLFTILGNLRLTEEDIMQMMPDTEEFRFEKEVTDKNWSKRRESAILLDNLGHLFGGECFLILRDSIQGFLLSSDWLSIESGLLALGALAPGSSEALVPSLNVFLPFLLQQTGHAEKLVVAMALWTISRFTDHILGSDSFQPYLQAIVKSLMIRENIVQQAACTAFCILISRNPEELHNYLDEILQIFAQCLEYYRGKALVNLLDAVCSVADILGPALREPKYIQLLFSPLFSLWTRTKDTERLLWTLCESLSSVILAMGDLLQDYFQPILDRCCLLISQGLKSHEKQYSVKALELAGVVIETYPLLNLTYLYPLLLDSFDDKDTLVKQYAAATAGDLVFKNAPGVYQCIDVLIPKLVNCLYVLQGPEDISNLFSLATNNAACALSEIAVNFPQSISAHTQKIIKILVECTHNTNLPQVKSNLMTSIGKLGNANPEALACEMSEVLYQWCEYIKIASDSKDKFTSFMGIIKALLIDGTALNHNFQFFAERIVEYKDMPEELRNHAKVLFQQVKIKAAQGWDSYVAQLPFRNELLINFQV